MRREYKTGSKYAVWAWKDIRWQGELYLRRLILVQTPLFSVMVHFINAPDRQRHLHDHPVDMLSFVLKGKYLEDYRCNRSPYWNGCLHVCQRQVKWLNWIPATKIHKITNIPTSMIPSEHGVITLCFAGPRRQEWGFYTEDGWVHWKEYHEMYDASTT